MVVANLDPLQNAILWARLSDDILRRFRMYRKTSFAVLAAAAVLVAGAPGALASHHGDSRDRGPNEHQTDLDQAYARTHPLIMPGTPVTISAPDGYVPPHHPKTKHLTRRVDQ
jgi:hypothetical protein